MPREGDYSSGEGEARGDLLPVIQADRDAAADGIRRRLERANGKWAWIDAAVAEFRDGDADDAYDIQAFARHRIDHSSPDLYAVVEGFIAALDGEGAETTRRADLVKAGALIVAEIERLDRKEMARG